MFRFLSDGAEIPHAMWKSGSPYDLGAGESDRRFIFMTAGYSSFTAGYAYAGKGDSSHAYRPLCEC